ncbi:hypothetical protein [Phormidesmis priestleyi]|uniref:hypothetical protein n=1 Tax=Phormidesmis priestleyi TaxID=268141 RepID=UPI0011605098|nr:hypothetical protein [Phormidesmis priestleyi]
MAQGWLIELSSYAHRKGEMLPDSLRVANFSGVSAATAGEGSSGKMTINVRNTVLLENDGVIATRVTPEARGNGKDVSIKAGSLVLLNGGQVQAGTQGRGNAGNVIIEVRDRIVADGEARNGFSSGVLSTVESSGSGESGDIKITAGSLLLYCIRAQIACYERTESEALIGCDLHPIHWKKPITFCSIRVLSACKIDQ